MCVLNEVRLLEETAKREAPLTARGAALVSVSGVS